MKRVALVVLIAASAATASAQPPGWTTAAPAPPPQETRVLSGERVLQTPTVNIVRPVETRIIKGAPYSGDAVTEFTQVLSDGNRIQRKSVTRTFRDSEGRTRREQTTTSASGERVNITISDPVAGLSWVLDPQNRTATQNRSFFAAGSRGGRVSGGGSGESAVARGSGGGSGGRGGAAAAPTHTPSTVMATPPVLPARHSEDDDQLVKEDLGQKSIEGVMAEGTRTTTTIPAGRIGNAQAIKVVAEQWFSPDLQVLIMTRHADPRSGETIYRLSNIIRGEQDRSLFEVPADYTIQDRRQ
jgi:hypothetical protein